MKEGRLDDRCQVLRSDWDQWRWAGRVYSELSSDGPVEEDAGDQVSENEKTANQPAEDQA